MQSSDVDNIFLTDYKELHRSGVFKVISDWNVANPDISLILFYTETDVRYPD